MKPENFNFKHRLMDLDDKIHKRKLPISLIIWGKYITIGSKIKGQNYQSFYFSRAIFISCQIDEPYRAH